MCSTPHSVLTVSQQQSLHCGQERPSVSEELAASVDPSIGRRSDCVHAAGSHPLSLTGNKTLMSMGHKLLDVMALLVLLGASTK